MKLIRAPLGRVRLLFRQYSLYFSLLAGNFGGEGFARDCVLRQTVSTAEKLCCIAPEISEKGRRFAVFPQQTGPEKMAGELVRSPLQRFFSRPSIDSPVSRTHSDECLAITSRT